MVATLALSAVLHYAIAAGFAFVGLRLAQRDVDAEARAPMLALAAWWLALGGSTVLTATTDLLGSEGATDLAVFSALGSVNNLLVVAGLAALMFYLGYVFTGRQPVLAATLFAVVVFALLMYHNAARVPVGVELQAWDTDLAFARPDAGLPRALLFLLVLGPPMLGAAGLLALYRRAPGPTQRFRILLVAGSILLWFGAVLVAAGAGLDMHPVYGLVARLAGVAAAGAALLAYFPPAWARRRYGVESIAARGSAERGTRAP